MRIVCCRAPKTIGSKKVSPFVDITRFVSSHIHARAPCTCLCIVDGSGYVEDGREIFDEVDEDDEIDERSSKKRKSDALNPKENKKRLRDVNKPAEGKGSIRNLFGNVTARKKKEPQVKLEEDDILAGILDEIGPESSGTSNITSVAGPSKVNNGSVGIPSTSAKLNAKTEMAMVKQYMDNLTKAVHKKPTAVKSEATSDDDVSCSSLNLQFMRRILQGLVYSF